MEDKSLGHHGDRHQWKEYEGRLVDPFTDQMIRYHVNTEEEFLDMIAFFEEQPDEENIRLLFQQIGKKLDLIWPKAEGKKRFKEKTLIMSILPEHQDVKITEGTLYIPRRSMPNALAAAAVGRSVRNLVEHPYVPENINVICVEEDSDYWKFIV